MQPIMIDSFIIFADDITQTTMDVELLFEGKILHVYVGCHFHHYMIIICTCIMFSSETINRKKQLYCYNNIFVTI